MEYPYVDQLSGKTYRYRYLSEDNDEIRIGEFQEDDELWIPITVAMFGVAELNTLKELQAISMNNTCFLFPDWVESGMAVYKRIVNAWDPMKISFPVIQINKVPLMSSTNRKIKSTTDISNNIIKEVLTFVLQLHEKSLVLDRFSSEDFVILEDDDVPKLWRTGISKPSQNEFERLRRQNLIDLAQFFRNFVSAHILTLPEYTNSFIRQLEGGEIGSLNCHVQVLGFSKSVIALKHVLDMSRWFEEGHQLHKEVTCIKNHFLPTYVTRRVNGMPAWKGIIIRDKDCYWNETLNHRFYKDSIDEFFNCVRNLLTHLTENVLMTAHSIYFIIEDKFPNLISRFLNKVQEYPGIAQYTSIATWSIEQS